MPREQNDEGKYTTTDFYTTAVLVLRKFEVLEIRAEGKNDKVKRFVFEDTTELRDTILSYMNGSINDNLREFRNAIETVKDMVHSG